MLVIGHKHDKNVWQYHIPSHKRGYQVDFYDKGEKTWNYLTCRKTIFIFTT